MPTPLSTNTTRTRTASLILGLTALALIGLIGRVAQIQQGMGHKLAAQAQQQHRSRTALPARRGMIVDARGRILATSMTEHVIFADPAVIRDPNDVAHRLAPMIDCQPGELLTKLQQSDQRRYVVLHRRATDAQVQAVRRMNLAGVDIEQRMSRSYPMNSVAAHVLGFTGADGSGLEGIELAFDSALAGQDGYRTVLRDVRRRAIWTDSEDHRQPRDGANLILTIDAAIQSFAEQKLAQTVEQFEARGGCAIVVDPVRGDILAMANHPTFNPNWPGDYPVPSRRNRAITDPVEPGSTMKPFIAAAALVNGVARLDETLFCYNGYYPKARLSDHHPYGDLTFREVVVKSSNIGMALIGERMGNQRLYEVCSQFGFGQTTGIELRGESPGIVRPLRTWSRPDTTRITMGQGPIVVTAAQLTRAFCALVNGGNLIQLSILRGIVAPNGEIIQEQSAPRVLARALPTRIADQFAREVLLEVVDNGTGRQAQLEHWHVMGKTGTAQVPSPKGGYEPDAYIASFVGAAPATDPRLVVMVMIDRPNRALGYYGGTVAAPAVGEILGHSLAYLGVEPDKFKADQVSSTRR